MTSIVRQSMLRHACRSSRLTATIRTKTPQYTTSTFQQVPSAPKASPRLVQRLNPQKQSLSAVRIAAFHATTRREILPPLPERLQGTVNDPAPVPQPDPPHGNYHWTFERAVSILLIPVTIAPFAGATAYPLVDASLCALLLAHSHTGFQSVIVDYLPRERVPRTRRLADWGLGAGTVLVAVGLYEFETNDVGLTEGIRRVWTAKS